MARLLIVEDDDDIRDATAEVLSARGYDVEVAHDGEDGLRRLGTWSPDIILLDVEMPRVDGPEMVRRMLAHGEGWDRIPVILLSGSADLTVIARCVGTPYFLEKPADRGALMHALEIALRERASPSPHELT